MTEGEGGGREGQRDERVANGLQGEGGRDQRRNGERKVEREREKKREKERIRKRSAAR